LFGQKNWSKKLVQKIGPRNVQKIGPKNVQKIGTKVTQKLKNSICSLNDGKKTKKTQHPPILVPRSSARPPEPG
jgi:hypothetical protein